MTWGIWARVFRNFVTVGQVAPEHQPDFWSTAMLAFGSRDEALDAIDELFGPTRTTHFYEPRPFGSTAVVVAKAA